MTISLQKGGNVSLTKQAPGLTDIKVGLGWDARVTDGSAFDLDASVFLVTDTGKVRGQQDFIFFNQLKSDDGSVEHMGDNLTGEGEGDDEVVKVNLPGVNADIQRLIFAVTIYDAEARNQNFGMVQNAFIRVINQAGDAEIARYDLSEDFSMENALIFGEVYRHNEEWKFKAIGQGFMGGLKAIAEAHGVQAG